MKQKKLKQQKCGTYIQPLKGLGQLCVIKQNSSSTLSFPAFLLSVECVPGLFCFAFTFCSVSFL